MSRRPKDKDKPPDPPKGKRRTGGRWDPVLLATVISLLVGFVGGMVFQAYRSGSTGEERGSAGSSPAPGGASPDVRELEKEAAEDPDSADAWARLGHAYFDSNRYDEAIRAYRRSLDIDASQADVWTDLGVMYRRSGRSEEAVRAFDRAVEADPQHEVSRFNKGVVLLHDLQDVDGAIEAWEGLVRINPMAAGPNGQPVMEILESVRASQGKDG